jgi:tRNA dimethylallyltransferase
VTVAPPLIVVAGATATGKTQFGIALAEAILARGRAAIVVSADSRQVYRGMDIGTAKVGADGRARVEHHGLDLVEPDEPFSAADFYTHARGVLAEVRERDGVALLVGGTGLYLRAVARGIDLDALPNDPDVRARLEADLETDGLPALAARLDTLAPTQAQGIDHRNPRRVVRALEIAELIGDAPRPAPRGYPGASTWIGLMVKQDVHHRRIADRARGQFASGLLDEARALRDRFDPGLPAFSAIGYREAWSVIDGERTVEAAIESDIQRNVAFAKRQATWFRSETGVDWIGGDPDPLAVLRSPRVAAVVG